MSTQTAALPDGTKLTKPASGEKVSLSVINTNTDNIANNIISIGNVIDQNSVKVTDLNNCTDSMKNYYCDGTASHAPIASYLQIRVINASPGANSYYSQIAMPMNSTTARIWIRTKSPTEWSPWTELAPTSQLETKIPSTTKICVNYSNGTQYTFPVTKANAGAYSYFLLVGGSSSTNGFVYHGFIHVSGNYATWLTLIGGTAVPGIAASYDGTNLVITMTNTQYGGLRLIWLG